MQLKISFLLLISFYFMSVWSYTLLELFRDPVLSRELKTLHEKHFNENIIAKMDTKLAAAQLIIDSNMAPESVTQELQSLTAKWCHLKGRASPQDYAKFKDEFKWALWPELYNEYYKINKITGGAYGALMEKSEDEERKRLTDFENMSLALVNMTELRLKAKEADNSLIKAVVPS